ncbi:transcription initiation factor TFIIIB [Bacillus mycoides]|uniref:transcription initiation factor TFIIIB n=1 Tax=Bacillus mycoides TaxID=1405 RepID=UPI001C018614|nr:transcription initiation factor TFIIIB [Bacillus mycoides]QWI52507.1 transcription initiation factor TFIIIB [Bacillus mycoides]
MTKTIECKKCGHLNDDGDIYYMNTTCGASCGCEGYEYDLTCSACDNEIYSGSEWGQFDRTEVFDDIIDELAESDKTNEHNERK